MWTPYKSRAVVALASVLAVFSSPAQEKRTVWDSVYSLEQARRGAEVFKTQCASCHGENMTGGGGAPAAAGPEFIFNWKGKSLNDLFGYVKANMPPGNAGSLRDQKYTDIVAAILQTSEFPAGKADLPPDGSALAEIQITADKP